MFAHERMVMVRRRCFVAQDEVTADEVDLHLTLTNGEVLICALSHLTPLFLIMATSTRLWRMHLHELVHPNESL